MYILLNEKKYAQNFWSNDPVHEKTFRLSIRTPLKLVFFQFVYQSSMYFTIPLLFLITHKRLYIEITSYGLKISIIKEAKLNYIFYFS